MKKQLLSLFMLIMFFSVISTYGQGLENFNNYVGTSGTYSNGTFIGQDGSTWSYSQCRSDRAITAPSPCLGKARNPTGKVVSGTLLNGCGTLSFDYKQGYSTAVNLNVYVNNLVVGNVTSPGGNGDTSIVHNSGPILVNAPGSFVLMFKQADSTASGQVTVDNVSWTAFGGGPLPEPTNYPTNYTATPSPFTINLAWTDAVGAQLPGAYLILASDQNNIVAPVDGTPVSNDPNLADGLGALNVLQGVQSAVFGNLPANKQYYFKIFPYTNSGALINYKTDGTAPSATATTTNTVIIDSIHFSNYNFSNWIVKNVTGSQVWVIDSIHGINNGPCGKVSGFQVTSNVNEDWLISPAMNFNNYINEALTFQSAYKYTGPALEALISNDYDGLTNPNDFTWSPLTATWSPGNWVWTPSGSINISGTNGSQVYIGFKYTSTATESSTWELDDIVITGDLLIGINEKISDDVDFSVNPNPATGKCSLTFTKGGSKEIRVISVIGTTVLEATTDLLKYSLNLYSLSPGIYFVQAYSPASKITQVRKLIIR
ncbi:MAG: choice-of-anchor J domain-containing protein [Bacteroidales bacterium]|nr:choice-of-anchor J domain-containing protein [Bacteroidales bacterium]